MNNGRRCTIFLRVRKRQIPWPAPDTEAFVGARNSPQGSPAYATGRIRVRSDVLAVRIHLTNSVSGSGSDGFTDTPRVCPLRSGRAPRPRRADLPPRRRLRDRAGAPGG